MGMLIVTSFESRSQISRPRTKTSGAAFAFPDSKRGESSSEQSCSGTLGLPDLGLEVTRLPRSVSVADRDGAVEGRRLQWVSSYRARISSAIRPRSRTG